MLPAAGFLGRLDDLFGDDFAVRARNLLLGQLARYALLDQMSEAESDLGNCWGGNGRYD